MIESHKAEHFAIEEFVPESVYMERGGKAWQLIDIRLIENADSLREQLGVPLIINNWHLDGLRDASGFRISEQRHYKPYSQHSSGRALDCVCEIPADVIRDKILNKDIILPHPACFETGVSWLHMDVRNMTNGHTYFFKP